MASAKASSIRHIFSLTSPTPIHPSDSNLLVFTLRPKTTTQGDSLAPALARLIVAPVFDWKKVELTDTPHQPSAKKRKDQSRYQRKAASVPQTFVSAKILVAAHQFYLSSLQQSLEDETNSGPVPTSLYAGEHLGVSFLAPPSTSSANTTVEMSSFTCPNLLSLLPSKQTYQQAISSIEVTGKESFQATVDAFLSLLSQKPVLLIPKPPSSSSRPQPPQPRIIPFDDSNPLPPHPSTLSCLTCGKLKLRDLSSGLDHLKTKHPHCAHPAYLWTMHHPIMNPPPLHVPPSPSTSTSSTSTSTSTTTTTLEVAFIDPYVAIVVKPQGITVQGGPEPLIKSDLLLPVSYSLSANRFRGWPDESDHTTSCTFSSTTYTNPASENHPSYDPIKDAMGKVKPAHR